MKKKLLRLILLPAIACALLAGGSFVAIAAHAATPQPQVSRVTCNYATDVIVDTDYNPYTFHTDVDCFRGTGSQNVNLYNVSEMYTGHYTVTWNWTDCNGGKHHSSKGPATVVDAYTSPGEFAGFYVMCDITYLALS